MFVWLHVSSSTNSWYWLVESAKSSISTNCCLVSEKSKKLGIAEKSQNFIIRQHLISQQSYLFINIKLLSFTWHLVEQFLRFDFLFDLLAQTVQLFLETQFSGSKSAEGTLIIDIYRNELIYLMIWYSILETLIMKLLMISILVYTSFGLNLKDQSKPFINKFGK